MKGEQKARANLIHSVSLFILLALITCCGLCVGNNFFLLTIRIPFFDNHKDAVGLIPLQQRHPSASQHDVIKEQRSLQQHVINATETTDIPVTRRRRRRRRQRKGNQGQRVYQKVNVSDVPTYQPPGCPPCKPLRNHPFAGARDSKGCFGYIHDPTYVRMHESSSRLSQEEIDQVCNVAPPGKSIEGKQGIQALDKIQIMPDETNNPLIKRKKVLCLVYTHSNHHDTFLKSIVQTYAPHCDGFMAASNKTDINLGAVDLLHAGPETYENMWQKVRSMWAYVYTHYRMDYDWFHIGGDDMFVIAQNLKHALGELPTDVAIYTGAAMIRYPRVDTCYCGGGAGYTLNRRALEVLITQQLDRSECWPDHVGSDEDKIIASCLEAQNIHCLHNVDLIRGETRYHSLDAQFHANWEFPFVHPWYGQILAAQHNITAAMLPRLEQISTTTVSFHLVHHHVTPSRPKRMRFAAVPQTNDTDGGMLRYHVLVHGQCGENNGTKALS